MKFSLTPTAALVLVATALIALLCLNNVCVLADLNPKRMHLVDFNLDTQHYLFRGNFPGSKHEITYDYLMDSLRTRAKEQANIELPEKLRLVDITFLQSLIDRTMLQTEKEFWKQNEHLGRMVHWTIVGHPINASSLPSNTVRKALTLHTGDWDFSDKLIERVDTLYRWVHSLEESSVPTVYYIHCAAGVDRTGQVSGAYYMRHLGWSWLRSLQFDYMVSPRAINSWNQNGMNWYCWWLYYTTGAPTDCRYGL